MINLIQIFLVFRGHHYFDDSINFHRGERGGRGEATWNDEGNFEKREEGKEVVPPLKFISSPLAEYQCRLFQTFLFGTFLIDFCTNSTHFFCTINGVIGSRGSADNKNLVRGMNYLGREFRLSHFEFFKGLFERGGGGNIDMDERPKRVKCNIVTVMDLYIRSVVSNISKCFSLQRG